jgi:protein tyrosine/serine phosphatase
MKRCTTLLVVKFMTILINLNNWLNHKVVYPYLKRLYWNCGVVDRYMSDTSCERTHGDGSCISKTFHKKGSPKVLRSRLPNGEFIRYLAQKHHLRTIVSLEDDYDIDMDKWCKKYKIKHITTLNHVSAKTIFSDKKDLDTFYSIIDNALHYPMLIRCRAGADRTGVACAIYHIEKHHWSNIRAWLEMLLYGHIPFKFKHASSVVLGYIPRIQIKREHAR